MLIAVLSALTKIGINSFTGLFWHFRRQITSYLISNVGSWLAVVYWVLHGVVLLCAAVYWTSKFGLQAIGSGTAPSRSRALSPRSRALTRISAGIPEVKSILSVRCPCRCPLIQHALTILS